MSGCGGSTGPQVSGAHTPAPWLTPPAAVQAAADRSSHSFSSPVAFGTQHMTSGFGGTTSAQVSTSQTPDLVVFVIPRSHRGCPEQD